MKLLGLCLVVIFGLAAALPVNWSVPIPYYGEEKIDIEYYTTVFEKVIKGHYEYPGYDGWYNNRAHPDWGGADMPMLRRLPHAYKDGVYQPSGSDRPNPIAISQAIMKGDTGKGSERNRTAFLVFFGQQVVEEILDAQRPGCPPEYFNISIPQLADPHPSNPENVSGTMMPLLRNRYDMRNTGYSPNSPREQLNEITPYMDGGLMYGVGKAWADALRSLSGGRLASTNDNSEDKKEFGGRDFPAVNTIRLPMANPPPPRDHYLKNVNRFWKLGNPRGNENPFLLTFGILWYRWHNHVADRISSQVWKAYQEIVNHPNKTRILDGVRDDFDEKGFLEHYDEKIFNEARKWVIATHQKVVTYDWLPSWLGTYANGTVFKLPEYKGYNPNVHPQIMHVFQSAAMRFGHTLVPPGVYRREKSASRSNLLCNPIVNSDKAAGEVGKGKKALRTCNSYWNPQDPIKDTNYDIDNMILGMSAQQTEKEDTIITPDLRGFVFGGLDFSRRDLMAVNIQRGRDHGLPDYNTARKHFGLKEWKNFYEIREDICPNKTVVDNNPECFFIKGLIEVYGNDISKVDIWPGGLSETTGDGPGPLFRNIIADQFERIRDGDRFWFESKFNGLFSEEQVEKIRDTNLRQVILEVTDIKDFELGGNPFFILSGEEKCKRMIGRLAQELKVNQTEEEILASFNNNTNCSSATCEEVYQHALTNFVAVDSTTTLETQLKRFLDCDGNENQLSDDPCWDKSVKLPVIDGDDNDTVEACTELKHFDYFSGSEVSYILTFAAVGLFTIGVAGLMVFCAKRRQASIQASRKGNRAESRRKSNDLTQHEVVEWEGAKEGERDVKVKLDLTRKAVVVTDSKLKKQVRRIECTQGDKIYFKEISGFKGAQRMALIKTPREYDLILLFDGLREYDAFLEAFREFVTDCGLNLQKSLLPYKEMLKEAVTKSKRQQLLNKFFRVIFKHAFRLQEVERESNLTETETQAIIHCELTQTEFADSLGMKPNALFVKNMFELIDKDRNGLVSFREFLDMIVIFAKGTGNDKAKLLFDMYDVDQTGVLSRNDFRTMIKSLMELANATVDTSDIDKVISSMLDSAGMTNKEQLSVEDFNRLLADHKKDFQLASLAFNDQHMPIDQAAGDAPQRTKTRVNAPTRARQTVIKAIKETGAVERKTKRQTAVNAEPKESRRPTTERSAVGRLYNRLANLVERNMLQIFWLTLYILLGIAIFAERAYYYSFEREHAALRRIAGYGVTVTRGAASGMMFTYSTLLLTMCRNLITLLRETFLNRFIPFDSVITFHKFVAYYALVFTGIHIIGHAINFYHISTQTPGDLSCLFRNFYRPSHYLPKFYYWCWGTITGITGVVLTLMIITMFIFAQQYARRNVFKGFWMTHQLHYLVYLLTILHGAGILVQAPLFWTFFVGPAVLFTIDKLISLSRNATEITVFKADILPSGVTGLTFKKPSGFEYRSGQWVRIACIPLGESEYHPFTLTSAPHEDYLSLHIRAVGPWTENLRRTYDTKGDKLSKLPKLYLDGPFGEGHQDWWKFDVAVLVGGGIGVTPFASILKDIVHKSSIGAKFGCKKVYFMWTCRSQKQYEWLVEIIRDVEEQDKKDFVSTHIFITQFYQKFDLRTTMLYICEKHFQKVSEKSLFTGLRSITHFGRPNFPTFLESLKDEHPGVSKIGVFSCGPPQMTKNVDTACSQLNKDRASDEAIFSHHFENF